MSIQSSSGVFSTLKLSDCGDKPSIELTNGVKIFSLAAETQAGAASALPNHSLYIDAKGAFGVVEGGILKPFLFA